MRVNVVTVRSGWILQKIAERIVKAGNEAGLGEFTLSHSPHIGVDVNFYCDVQNCYRGKTGGLDIGLFTHVHADDLSTVSPVTYTLDYIFHMATRYMSMFHANGLYPLGKMSTMLPWDIPQGLGVKKTTLGVFQRGKYEGKGFGRMMALMDWAVSKHFKFVFVGNDWEEVVKKGLKNGVECIQYTDSTISYPEGYNRIYDQVDYLLVPSKWEGGPICVLEAAAKGLPIISADVGWVREVVGFAEIFQSDADLAKILSRISSEKIIRRSYVDPSLFTSPIKGRYGYANCAKQIVEVAEKL